MKILFEEFFERLDGRGFKEIGCGDYARVFQHPRNSNTVIKVSVNEDDGAINWLRWCRDNPSRYVPRVRAVIEIQLQRNEYSIPYFIAYMELLTEADVDEINSFIQVNQLSTIIKPLCIGDDGTQHWSLDARELNAINDPELYRTIDAIQQMCELTYADLKVSNFMLRGSQVVITDPVPY